MIFSLITMGRNGDVVLPCQLLLCKIALLRFMDDEANVLQSVKHSAAFAEVTGKYLSWRRVAVCAEIRPAAKRTPRTLGEVFSAGGSDQLSSLRRHVLHYSRWMIIELFCVLYSVS